MYCVNEALQRLEYDLHIHLNHMRRIPVEWEQIYTDRCHHKSRITMRVKQDVLMGGGGETMTEYRETRWADRDRPEFGDLGKMMREHRGE